MSVGAETVSGRNFVKIHRKELVQEFLVKLRSNCPEVLYKKAFLKVS